MEPLLKDWLTIGLSSAAFIVSCASFVLSWQNFRRDRSHLRITLKFEDRPQQQAQYEVTITNDGRRSAKLIEVAALLWFRKRHIIYQQDTSLGEGEQKSIIVPLAMIHSISTPLSIRAFQARDSVGHIYCRSTLRFILRIIMFPKQHDKV
jgi:hypothetical protein